MEFSRIALSFPSKTACRNAVICCTCMCFFFFDFEWKKKVHHFVEMYNRSLDALPTHSRTVLAYLNLYTTCNYIFRSRLVGLPCLCELCEYRCVCVCMCLFRRLRARVFNNLVAYLEPVLSLGSCIYNTTVIFYSHSDSAALVSNWDSQQPEERERRKKNAHQRISVIINIYVPFVQRAQRVHSTDFKKSFQHLSNTFYSLSSTISSASLSAAVSHFFAFNALTFPPPRFFFRV